MYIFDDAKDDILSLGYTAVARIVVGDLQDCKRNVSRSMEISDLFIDQKRLSVSVFMLAVMMPVRHRA